MQVLHTELVLMLELLQFLLWGFFIAMLNILATRLQGLRHVAIGPLTDKKDLSVLIVEQLRLNGDPGKTMKLF